MEALPSLAKTLLAAFDRGGFAALSSGARSMALVWGLCCLLISGSVAAEPQDLSFASLREILLHDQPTSIAATLQLISQQFPSYLAHHTLAYHSISLHASSAANPRAIVFGRQAEFIISFNGDPAQRGFGALEVMEFSPERGYAFREISFLREAKNGADLIDGDEIELKTADLLISKPNPSICTGCHGIAGPRPIWEPFAIWPGLYGSVDDRLYRYVFDQQGRAQPGDQTSVPDLDGIDFEKDGYAKYLINRQRHPRYSLLPLPLGLDRVAFESKPAPDGRRRPNLALTRLFSIQAAKLLARDAGAGPNGPANLLALAAVECVRGNSSEAVPAALMPIIEKATAWRDRFKLEIAGMTRRDIDRMQDYFERNLRLGTDDSELARQAASQPYLLATALDRIGMNIRNYAFNANRVASLQDGANGLFALNELLRDALQRQWRWDHPPTCAEIYAAL
ncbi:MAG: hypothetical protein HXX15_08960 [Rhodopseudomonas sp.]|uniref:hypothetical protein n=1 Tax=Rhodopseudomonas sp. TaxID=1078 RepID=UPI0017D26FDC|nr:hypothetical protein [Rhodopseudomonas sp.]NVN86204.1 hypothetical protein [Rhodopseudomonas sp.]